MSLPSPNGSRPVRVYLGDLRHNHSGVLATDCMPLNVAYIKAVMDRDVPEAESSIYAYPDRLLRDMQAAPPDILMLSNYVWNEALSRHFFELGKKLNPKMLTVMGGPNIPLEPERRMAYFDGCRNLDIYALGEGDFLASEIVKQYLGAGASVEALLDGHIPSSVYRRPAGEIVHTPDRARAPKVDEIPSPWLGGILDEFFDGSLAPMIETNRGCPFTCTFCVQGTAAYTKVHYFSQERVFEELDYIARRIKSRCPHMGTLRIADSNYGMFARDVEISDHIGRLQREFGWPTFIDATTGKNRPERVIESIKKASGALVVYQAVQSMDEEVLRRVKRQNIKLEAYEQLQVFVRGRGLRANSDLILGLPGESLASHLDGIRRLIDAGVQQIHNFQLMMLKGSELESAESRRMFAAETRFRLVPKGIGVYGDGRVLESEEIVVATDSLPFEDYVTARKYHLTSSALWNHGWFEDAVRFVERLGARRSECWGCFLPLMEQDGGAVRDFLENFVRETKGELFPSRQACAAFCAEDGNFEKVLNGEIGDNLMYKYRAVASFFLWPEICRVGMAALKGVALSHGAAEKVPEFEPFWASLAEFVKLQHADGDSEERILSPAVGWLHYDIPRWIAEGRREDPTPFRFPAPEPFEFRLSEEGAENLAGALKTWTTNLKGLTKLVTRIQVEWQIRKAVRCAAVEAADPQTVIETSRA